jgi:hypothetical protein
VRKRVLYHPKNGRPKDKVKRNSGAILKARSHTKQCLPTVGVYVGVRVGDVVTAYVVWLIVSVVVVRLRLVVAVLLGVVHRLLISVIVVLLHWLLVVRVGLLRVVVLLLGILIRRLIVRILVSVVSGCRIIG